MNAWWWWCTNPHMLYQALDERNKFRSRPAWTQGYENGNVQLQSKSSAAEKKSA
jgi:hypothetical protein